MHPPCLGLTKTSTFITLNAIYLSITSVIHKPFNSITDLPHIVIISSFLITFKFSGSLKMMPNKYIVHINLGINSGDKYSYRVINCVVKLTQMPRRRPIFLYFKVRHISYSFKKAHNINVSEHANFVTTLSLS